MLERVTIRATDRAASEAFYDTVLQALGVERSSSGQDSTEWSDFALAAATAEHPVTRRLHYTPDYYGGFLLDPDGNSAEAVHHGAVRKNGIVDHLWIRVADVASATAFYATIAPDAGLRAGHQMPGFAQFRSDGGSVCLVTGTATEHLHMAFGVSDDAGAAVMADPDGNSVELVSARR